MLLLSAIFPLIALSEQMQEVFFVDYRFLFFIIFSVCVVGRLYYRDQKATGPHFATILDQLCDSLKVLMVTQQKKSSQLLRFYQTIRHPSYRWGKKIEREILCLLKKSKHNWHWLERKLKSICGYSWDWRLFCNVHFMK